jgi:hypothetical protein
MERAAIALALVAAVSAAVLARRARRPQEIDRINPADFGLPTAGRAVTGFTAPYCLPCQDWQAELSRVGLEPRFVDVSERPDLARRYRIDAAPWIALVDLQSGRVLREWRDSPTPSDVVAVQQAIAYP